MEVTKDMIIADVLMKDRALAPIFMGHGLHCLGCAAANMETIEEAASVHGIDADALLKDLNAFLSTKQAE
jgi:hybrid cluster-associated redox disulfide protein